MLCRLNDRIEFSHVLIDVAFVCSPPHQGAWVHPKEKYVNTNASEVQNYYMGASGGWSIIFCFVRTFFATSWKHQLVRLNNLDDKRSFWTTLGRALAADNKQEILAMLSKMNHMKRAKNTIMYSLQTFLGNKRPKIFFSVGGFLLSTWRKKKCACRCQVGCGIVERSLSTRRTMGLS